MSSRKNKVLIVFALLIITLNIFTFANIAGQMNNQPMNETVLPSQTEDPGLSNVDDITSSEYNDTYFPNMNLWDLDINVTRAVFLNSFGYITVNDTYRIIKNDNITMPIFRFVLPKHWTSEIVEISALTMYDVDLDEDENPYNKTNVYVEHQTSDFTFYALKLIPVLGNSSDYIVKVHITLLRPYTIFKHVDGEGYLTNGLILNYSMVPLLSAKIDVCKSTFNPPAAEEGGVISSYVLPSDATVSEAVIFNDLLDVPAFNFSNGYDNSDFDDYQYNARIGAFLTYTAPLEATSYKRTVTLDNWYWAKVTEEITLKHFGVTPPDDFTYSMANELFYIKFALQRFYLWIENVDENSFIVKDDLGELTKPRDASGSAVQQNRVNIYLRVPVTGGESKTFQIEYRLKLEDIINVDKTEYLLDTIGMPRCDFHVRNFECKIIFPQGANFKYLTFGNQAVATTESKESVFLKIGRRDAVTFTATNITSFDNIDLVASYYMNDLAYYIQPLTIALVIFIACLAYIGVRTLRKDVIDKVIITPESEAEIPIEEIQDFVEKYEEKTALQTRLTQLDEDRRKKKIKAKEYDHQRKILESKVRDIIRELDIVKRKLKQSGRKYFSVIQKIEISEEKRTSVERSIHDLRIRYIREKQISKDAYIRILRDYQNQIDKFERDIDKEIINLRLLIEHESKDA